MYQIPVLVSRCKAFEDARKPFIHRRKSLVSWTVVNVVFNIPTLSLLNLCSPGETDRTPAFASKNTQSIEDWSIHYTTWMKQSKIYKKDSQNIFGSPPSIYLFTI